MNIKKAILTFWNLKKVYVLGIYMLVFASIFVSIRLVFACIASICKYQCDQHFCDPRLHANNCSTCKY